MSINAGTAFAYLKLDESVFEEQFKSQEQAIASVNQHFQGYQVKLHEVDDNLMVLHTEMEKVNLQFSENDKSIEATNARNAILNKTIEEQREKVSLLASALSDSEKVYGESSTEVKQWQAALNKAEAELNELNNGLEEHTGFC